MRLFATGFDQYIEEDRPQIILTGGGGNTDDVEVHLEFIDGTQDVAVQGWFKVSELQRAINEAARGQ